MKDINNANPGPDEEIWAVSTKQGDLLYIHMLHFPSLCSKEAFENFQTLVLTENWDIPAIKAYLEKLVDVL